MTPKLMTTMWSLLLSLLISAKVATPAEILFLTPLATKSETLLYNPMARAMLQRGHTVTLVTPASSSIKHKNFTEIVPVKHLDQSDFTPALVNDVMKLRKSKEDLFADVDFSFYTNRCHETYRNKEFSATMSSKKFDLIVMGGMNNECFLGLVHKLNAPYIQVTTMPAMKDIVEQTGFRPPLSFVPSPFMELSDQMSLKERIKNVMQSYTISLYFKFHFFQICENIYKQHIEEELPPIQEIRKNVSMIFTNTHFSLHFPRPVMPDIVEIAGVHVEDPKPLPKELEQFCSGGENGFVLFSMGTVFREESLTPDLLQTFIKVFSRLKVRVLWKWQGKIEGLPKNVMTSKWLPQQDVLGHPKIKMFITHGGLLSTTEATYHGVPVLGIPVLFDQDVNMKQVENHGFGKRIELLDITEEYLENGINSVLNDPSFAKNAKFASQVFRDQPQKPLDKTVYWMEYVIRYKGAPQLRSAARDLTYFEYYLYDVQLILFSAVALVLIVVWKLISYCLRCMGSIGGDERKRKVKTK